MPNKPINDFLKGNLEKILEDEKITLASSYFEPSSSEPIGNDDLTFKCLSQHLSDNYGPREKPEQHKRKIEKIVGLERAQKLIDISRSEYFKVLTHFTILSKIKQGWDNLLTTERSKVSKPSLSVEPCYISSYETKILNDALIYCFYSRLIEGMTDNEKKEYAILLPIENFQTGFDNLIYRLDKAIQDYFCTHQQIYNKKAYDEGMKLFPGYPIELLPDAGTEKIYSDLKKLIHEFLDSKDVDNGYIDDSLRMSLIKFSSINRAINEVDAILYIHNDVLLGLPNDIQRLLPIEAEDEILPAILSLFDESEENIPTDLIQCAKLLCEIYISSSAPIASNDDVINAFQENNRSPLAVAVSAALLCHDYLHNAEINLLIRGESVPFISVYDTLSYFSKLKSIDDRSKLEIIHDHGFPAPLFKYLTTRYSVSRFGLSEAYPSQVGAAAHLKVRRMKLELQREAYELLKELSIKDACQQISSLAECVNFINYYSDSDLLEKPNAFKIILDYFKSI